MSKRSDRAAERQAVKQAEQDLNQAGAAARKAFDLKDPRFLGEAAVAATRGPAGLALFGASRGLQVLRERRAEQAQLLGDLAADAKQHAEALREQTSVLAAPKEKKSALRRFAPLWIAGLAGGAAIAGATAYVFRDQGSSAPAPAAPATPTPPASPAAPANAAASATAGSDASESDATDASNVSDQPASDGTASVSESPSTEDK